MLSLKLLQYIATFMVTAILFCSVPFQLCKRKEDQILKLENFKVDLHGKGVTSVKTDYIT